MFFLPRWQGRHACVRARVVRLLLAHPHPPPSLSPLSLHFFRFLTQHPDFVLPSPAAAQVLTPPFRSFLLSCPLVFVVVGETLGGVTRNKQNTTTNNSNKKRDPHGEKGFCVTYNGQTSEGEKKKKLKKKTQKKLQGTWGLRNHQGFPLFF